MRDRRNNWRELLILGVFCWFFFFYGLAAFGLLGTDEPRYAQIAREMLERHDWVTPTLNGQPWLEKPVLYYWGAMLGYRTLGVSEGAARAPAAVLVTLMVAMIYFWAHRLRLGAGFDAALITCSAIGIFGFARGASTDMPLAACFTIAMLAWLGWWQSSDRRWLLGFYFFLAAAVLAKGPVAAVLAAGIVIIFAIVIREARPVWGTLWLPGIAVFLVVSLPWYALVELRNPQFFPEFILQQNLARFSSNLYRHPHPFWYFLPVLAIGLLPWSVLALAGAADACNQWRAAPSANADGPRHQEIILLLTLWAIFPVIFFSFSQSKLPGYILPTLPAWTLLASTYLEKKRQQSAALSRGWLAAHALMPAAVIAALAIAPPLLLDHHAALPMNAVLTAVAAGAVTLVAVFFAIRRWGLAWLRVVTLIPMILAVGYVSRTVAPLIDATQSARPVARDLANRGYSEVPLAVRNVSRSLEYGLGFYRDQRIYREEDLRSLRHVLVESPARRGSGMEILAPSAEAAGEFPAQHLRYWLISPPRH